MFDRRTIIALVVMVLIIALMPKYMELISPKRPPRPVATAPAQTEPAKADTTNKAAAPATAAPAEVQPQEPRVPGILAPDSLPVNPDFVRIETPLFEMTLGSNAQVSDYTLKKYKIEGAGEVDLHQAGTGTTPHVGDLDFNFGAVNIKSIKNLKFSASTRQIHVTEGADSVTFVAGDNDGQQVLITYVFHADKYGFELGLQTRKLNIPETGEYKIQWIGGVPITEPDPFRDVQYSAAYANIGGDIVKVTLGSAPRRDLPPPNTGSTMFVSARNKYFVAAIVPVQPAAGAEITGWNDAPKDKNSPHHFDLTLREPWGKDASGRWNVYWGPIKYDNLKSFGVGLEDTMSWGWSWIRPISKFILWALVALGSVIPNYGLVIILFSIMVKVVLWPLTRKSQISMKKMSALQPEIQAIRELHAKNAPAMNAAIMALYKERGVNPASGCLPILFQMPVFIALYQIFSSTIEFRQAPFIGWISDLSRPDAVYHLPFSIPMYGAAICILPLVMGFTQFIMAKRTTTDPNQKMMVYIMPVFMTLIFNSFPSGLTLYYTLFNVWAILEQNLIKVPDFTPSVSVVEEKKRKR